MAGTRDSRDNLSPPQRTLRGASPNDFSSFSDISSNDGNIVYTPPDSVLAPHDGSHSPLAGTNPGVDFLNFDVLPDMDSHSAQGSDRRISSPTSLNNGNGDGTPANRSAFLGQWSTQRLNLSSWGPQPPRIALDGNSTDFHQEWESVSPRSEALHGASHHLLPLNDSSRMPPGQLHLQLDEGLARRDAFNADSAAVGAMFSFDPAMGPWNSETPRFPYATGSEMNLFGLSEDFQQQYLPSHHTLSPEFALQGSLPFLPPESVPSSTSSPISVEAIQMRESMSRQSSGANEHPPHSNPQFTPNQAQPSVVQAEGMNWNPTLPTEAAFSHVTLQPSHRTEPSPTTPVVRESSSTAPPRRPTSYARGQRRRRAGSNVTARLPPSSQQSIIIEQYEGSHGQTKDRAASSRQPSNNRKAGGRPLGSHLTTDKAAKTKKMRADKACWLCSLQRDMCSPGETCERCYKRSHRPQADHALGCVRTKLPELCDQFLPRLLTGIHEDSNLRSFCAQHIMKWYSRSIRLTLECGRRLPWIMCEVYEFQPKTNESLRTFVGSMNVESKKQSFLTRNSPPLGMQMVERQDRQQYDQYINDIVDQHFETLANLYFAEETEMGFEFPARLLKMMYQLKRHEPDEVRIAFFYATPNASLQVFRWEKGKKLVLTTT